MIKVTAKVPVRMREGSGRMVVPLILETNDEWAVAGRYMSLESLTRITDYLNVRLPAVAP